MSLVKVTLAQLAAPLRVDRIRAGTTVSEYLERKEINFSSSVKVNGQSVKADYKLKNNDIITSAINVEGG